MVSLPPTNVVANAVRARLPKEVFLPARSRLWWLPLHWSFIVAGIFAIHSVDSVLVRSAVAVGLGFNFAGLAFVAHEALHGALCRRRRLRKVVGFLGFLPFCLSPRLWIAWHNRVHHGNTNCPGVDPDALCTLQEYRQSALVRWSTDLQRLTRGILTLAIGFSIQSTQVLLTARRRKMLPARHHTRAVGETLVGWTAWMALLALVGPVAFFFCFVVPLVLANALVMAHILTNHGLRPADEANDPLVSSTSVTTPRWLSVLTLDFGYHTEHHLFPAMSHRHGPEVSRVLRDLYPGQYHQLPLTEALWLVCRRPRVMLDSETLIDPHSKNLVHQFRGVPDQVQDSLQVRDTSPTSEGRPIAVDSTSSVDPPRASRTAGPSTPPPASAA